MALICTAKYGENTFLFDIFVIKYSDLFRPILLRSGDIRISNFWQENIIIYCYKTFWFSAFGGSGLGIALE